LHLGSDRDGSRQIASGIEVEDCCQSTGLEQDRRPACRTTRALEIINFKTARALGLTIPLTILVAHRLGFERGGIRVDYLPEKVDLVLQLLKLGTRLPITRREVVVIIGRQGRDRSQLVSLKFMMQRPGQRPSERSCFASATCL
jgi:hypothetical protein